MTESMKAGTRRIALGVMGLVYVVWGGVFIWENSVVAIDGRRYFVLFDDAMISMRYAWNLAHGTGLVWNAGERVEGITNLLMTLYMALPSLFLGKVAAVLVVEVSGVAFLIAMGLLCARIARQVMGEEEAPYREFVSTAAFLAPLAYYPLAFWTVTGMETGLLTLLMLWAVWQALRDEGFEDPPWLLGVTLGLMFLTRPDAVIPMGLILAYRASCARGSSSKLRSVAVAAGCAAGFVILLTAFRWIYYGSPVPNTYTLKVTGMPLLFRIENGWGFLLPFFGTIWVPVLIALLGLLTHWRKSALLLFALFAASVAYQDWAGGDPWNYWRMMAPTVPLLLILCLVEVAAFVRQVFTGPSISRYLSRKPVISSALLEKTAVAAAMLCLLALVNREFLGEALLTKLPDGMTSSRDEVDIAVALNEITAPTASLGVFKAGVSPYYTGRRGIDFLGKCDAHIASLPPDLTGSVSYYGMLSVPGHNKYDLHYSIEQLGPTYVAGKQRGTDAMNAFVDQHYVLVDHKGVNLLLKKDSPDVLWDNVRPWDWRMGMARILGKSTSMELAPEAEAWAQTKDLSFESTFTTGFDGWKSSGGSWQAANGYLAGEGTIGRPNTLRDFEAVLSYCFEGVSDETSRALIHLTSNNAGYSLRLNVYPGKMILDQISETGYARLGTNLDVRADAGVWYTLYVRCDGAHVEIWRAPLNGNGEPVLTTDRRAEIANERLLLGGAKVAVRYDGVAVLSERRAEGK